MTEQAMRDLATAGAPSVLAPPFLAERVLALHSRSVRRRRVGASLALAVLVATGAVAARGTGEARFYEVYSPSGSMAPTVGIGEHLVVDRRLTPGHEDLVEIHVHNAGDEFDTIRRVIGLPGDVIACPQAQDGFCHGWTRNGSVMAEPWTGRDALYPPGGPDPLPGFFFDSGDRIVPFPSVTVTAGHVFLLGDNRDNAVDSRTSRPVLQELARIRGVGVQVIGTDGRRRSIPGAQQHDGAPDGGTVDPPGPIPPANTAPVG